MPARSKNQFTITIPKRNSIQINGNSIRSRFLMRKIYCSSNSCLGLISLAFPNGHMYDLSSGYRICASVMIICVFILLDLGPILITVLWGFFTSLGVSVGYSAVLNNKLKSTILLCLKRMLYVGKWALFSKWAMIVFLEIVYLYQQKVIVLFNVFLPK